MAAARPLPPTHLVGGPVPRAPLRGRGGFLLVISALAVLLALTFTFPQPSRPPAVSPTMWPRLLLLLLLATAIADRVAARRAAGSDAAVPAGQRLVSGPAARAAIAFAAYALGLQFFGFHVATPLFTAAAAPIFGVRRPLQVAGLALGATLTIGIVFAGFLYLPLPRGDIPAFYQLNAGIDGLLTRLRP